MNFQAPGGAMNFGQLWHPPVSFSWMACVAILIFAVNLEAMSPHILRWFQSPIGFFIGFLIALASYQAGYPPLCFAVLFFLMMVWTKYHRVEGFHPFGNVDWVNNNKRWFVEKVLKERPLGIQEKDVATYPIQGDSQ